MSNEEKLRALLAEARDALSQGCWGGKCCTVRERIDAALAEPMTVTGRYPSNMVSRKAPSALAEPVAEYAPNYAREARSLRARLNDAERERDEALAEVVAVQVQIGMSDIRHGLEAGEIRRLLASLSDALHERDEARAGAASAFRRGAEAMREAAASCVGGDIALLQTYRSVLERRIRGLPVPEER